MKPSTSSSDQPSAEKVIVHLIKEELKSRRFFEGLRDLGLDDAFYQADLLELIMLPIGLSPESQDQYSFCASLLRQHSARVAQDAHELLNEARCVYALLQEYARGQPCPR